MAAVDYQYGVLLADILREGDEVNGRNGVTKRLHTSRDFVFDSTPLVSARRTAWKTALREWEWFMSGSNEIKDAHPSVRPWWEPWADENGAVFGNYSKQFRACRGHVGGVGYEIDQVSEFVRGIVNHPHGRRHILTTWNPVDMTTPKCKITNCHGTVVQAFVSSANVLDLFTYQRSVDSVVGLPHNWVQYWAFLLWLAHLTGTAPGKLIWKGGDVHVYQDHFPLVGKIVEAAALTAPEAPRLVYAARPPDYARDHMPVHTTFRAEDFALSEEYRPLISESAKMVV